MQFLENIKKLYQIKKNQGVNKVLIEKTEQRLNITLPKVLIEYQQTLGRSEQINESCNRILPLTEIDFANDYLIIAEESQQVSFWGIKKADLAQDNPPVFVCYDLDDEQPEWHLENHTLADFLLMMALFNATMGGLAYDANFLGNGLIEKSVVRQIESDWQEIPDLQPNGTRYFTHDFNDVIILCFDKTGECDGVFTGTNEQALFDKTLDLAIDWSYVSYEDDDFEDDEA